MASSPSVEELPSVEAVDRVHHRQPLATPTVGPYCRNADRAIEESVLDGFMFPDGHCLPIVEKWFSGGNFPKDIKTWPHPTTEWESWVERMMGCYEESWKQWGIFETIAMSTKQIKCDTSLIFTFLSFWNSKINSFVFPWGLMGPTLLDVTMITGLPVHGRELPEFYNWTEQREMPPIEKKAQQYSTYIKTFQRTSAIPSQTEHKLCLLYWFCRFFACVSGKSIVKAYTKFVDVIMSGEPIALGRYFLGLLFNSINQTLEKLSVGTVPATTMSGPWWFLQLWINLYFPQLFGPTADMLLSEVSTIYGLQLQHFPGSAFKERDIFMYLLSRKPEDKDFYPYSSTNNCSDFPHWILNVNDDGVSEQLAPIWNRILKPQALMIGYDVGDRFNPIGAELYSPQCLARQLGCKQGIPRPSTYLVKLGMLGRPTLEVSQIQALSSRQMINSYLPFKIDPGRRKGFTAWWEIVWQQIFPDEMGIYSNKFDNVSRRGKRKAPVTQRKRLTKQRMDVTSNQSVPDPIQVHSSGSQSPTTSRLIEERIGDAASSDERVSQDATPQAMVIPTTIETQPLADQEVTSVEVAGLLQPHDVEEHVRCREDGAEQVARATKFVEAIAENTNQSMVDTPKVPQPRSSEIMAVQTLARTIEESLAAVETVITQARAAAASTLPTHSARSIGLEAGRSNQVSKRISLDPIELTPILTRQRHSESASSAGNSPAGPSQILARVSEIFPHSQVPLPTQIGAIMRFDLDLSFGYLSELQMCLAQLAESESDAALTPDIKEEVDDLISKVIEINCIYPTIEPFQASSTQQLGELAKLKVEKRVIESKKATILASAENAEMKKIPLRQREAELVEVIAKAQTELTAIRQEMSDLDEVQIKAVHELAAVEEKMKSLQLQLSTAPILCKLHSSRQKTGHKIRIKLEAVWKQVQRKWSRLEARIDRLSRAPLKATYCAGADLTFRSLDRHCLY